MALQTDPSEPRRLIGDNTSETVFLSIADANNFPLGVSLLGGDDTVDSSAANNLVYGNEGEDILRGNLGNDSLFGGRGKDLLSGNAGNDYLSGGQDADLIYGFGGNDILQGGRGNDLLISGDGYDTLIGGLGRDFFMGASDNLSLPKIGSNLYVLQAESGVSDLNNADTIAFFGVGDRIGLAGGLTASDIVLERLTNVTIFLEFDGPQALKNSVQPGILNPGPIVTSGTLIRVKNSGEMLGFVDGVTPDRIRGDIISVQGF
jgi:Ca2+-binding RTX toxin-like protein